LGKTTPETAGKGVGEAGGKKCEKERIAEEGEKKNSDCTCDWLVAGFRSHWQIAEPKKKGGERKQDLRTKLKKDKLKEKTEGWGGKKEKKANEVGKASIINRAKNSHERGGGVGRQDIKGGGKI